MKKIFNIFLFFFVVLAVAVSQENTIFTLIDDIYKKPSICEESLFITNGFIPDSKHANTFHSTFGSLRVIVEIDRESDGAAFGFIATNADDYLNAWKTVLAYYQKNLNLSYSRTRLWYTNILAQCKIFYINKENPFFCLASPGFDDDNSEYVFVIVIHPN